MVLKCKFNLIPISSDCFPSAQKIKTYKLDPIEMGKIGL